MKNSELLLMGGGNPYADATHWITVGYGEDASAWLAGYSSAIGGITPSTYNGDTITGLTEGAYFSETYPNPQTLFTTQNAGRFLEVKITNLITGVTIKTAPSLKDTSELLGLRDFVGQTIPIKIEPI